MSRNVGGGKRIGSTHGKAQTYALSPTVPDGLWGGEPWYRTLRTFRRSRDRTLRSLGAAVDVDFTYLSKIENGHDRPSAELVARLDAELSAAGELISAFAAEPCRRCGLAASPAPDPGAGRDDGASRIAAERRRQVGVEGWSQDHDSAHTRGQLAIAAASYALPPDHLIRRPASGQTPPPFWPWEVRWWKPVYNGADPRSARIRELEKAGALVAAEIDRLLALAPSAEPPETTT